MGFDKFVSLFDKREEEMSVLYQYYKSSNTFYEFFRSIPIDDRCRLVGPWIEQFTKIILKDVFYNENWIITLPLEMNGGLRIKNRNISLYENHLKTYQYRPMHTTGYTY